jgi:hypothetical protein
MHRIDEAGHVGNLFTEGNPSLGQPATKVGDDWLNAVQEELCNAITGSGTALVKGTNTQLAAALALLFDSQGIEPGGRLTLQSTEPAPGFEVGPASTVFYTPYKHNRIKLYDGTRWKWYTFAELSQATTDATKSPAAVANNSNYDVFVWDDNGTLRATRGPAWTSDTGRGTGAGTTELEQFDGRRVNKNAITNGPAARRGLYVGSVRSDGSAQINDTYATRHVWNMYNRVLRVMQRTETATSWTYTLAAFREANGSTANRLKFLLGLNEDAVRATARASFTNTSGLVDGHVGIGLDGTGVLMTGAVAAFGTVPSANNYAHAVADWVGNPGLGSHFLSWLESSVATGTMTWLGLSFGTVSSGICGTILA